MKETTPFINRRKEHRLPYSNKIIFTDNKVAYTGYSINISRGGIFLTSLDSFPMDTEGYLIFCLPNYPESICVQAKCSHIVFDRQRCEVDCGMGFQFMNLTEQQISLINLFILQQRGTYLALQQLLASDEPSWTDIEAQLALIPPVLHKDLLGLRYRINRVCTLFETEPNPG